MDRYGIGDLCFYWEGNGYELAKGRYFEKFRIDAEEGLETIRFQNCFEPLEAYENYNRITGNYSYEVYDVNEEQFQIYHWAHNRFAFGIWPNRIHSDSINTCYLNPRLQEDVPMNADWFFGLIGLHKALLQKQAPILHGSYIDYQGKAILFSAPSQTGKSTQADLWADFAGAEIINGDRVLLRQRQGVWHAFGYPSCGSSEICINRTLPIRAIVILEQGEENKVIPMSLADKIRSLVAAIEVYRWDVKEVEQSIVLAEQIAMQVPVIRLSCTPDEDAVYVLKKYLEAEE